MKILITGGASGLGSSVTERLAGQEDNKIFITYNSSAQKAKELESKHKNITAVQCNFADSNELIALCELIQNENMEVLINNAHTTKIDKQYFHKLNPDTFSAGFHHNILPVIQITQAAIHAFRKKKYGKIITILSATVNNNPPMGYSEYTAGKAYLLSLSKSWAAENAGFNITSNTVSPAFMQTELTSDTDERIVEEMKNKHPLKRLLSTEEAADVVAFLCSCTQQLNGVNILINSAGNVI